MLVTEFKIHKVFILLLTISKTFSWETYKLDVCDQNSSIEMNNGIRRSNGDIVFAGVTFKNDEYYVDNATGIERGCECKKEHCIRKCCPLGYGYEIKTKMCVEVAEPFNFPVWNHYLKKRMAAVNATDLFHFVPGVMNCTPPNKIRIGLLTDDFHLGNDGRLYIMIPDNFPPWMVRNPEEYCIDTFVYRESSTESRETRLDALVCTAENKEERDHILSSTGMLISCVFILATLAVYAYLPELHNLHGRVLMAYLVCLFIAFLFIAIQHILLAINNISVETCIALTFVNYFSLLAAIHWLNVMCFDIWWTFSGKRGLSLEKMSIRTRFIAYCLYAFGIPTGLTVLLIILEFSGLPHHPLLPLIRRQDCFIYGTSKLLYLYGPITLLCIANLIFFVLTAMKITQIKRQTSMLKSKESSRHYQHSKDKQRLVLYIKLFILMGFNWILEVISTLYPEAGVFWRVTDAYNVLTGLVVFIIFVCKKKIFKLIKRRYKRFSEDQIPRNQTIISINR